MISPSALTPSQSISPPFASSPPPSPPPSPSPSPPSSPSLHYSNPNSLAIAEVDKTTVRSLTADVAADTRDTVFVVTYKRSALDKCKQPVGIRFFVSAAHTESDLHKAYESQKEQNGYTRVNCSAQSIESEHSLAIQDRAFRGNEDSLQLDKELERMKHNISLLPLTNYPSVQDLQKELAQRTLRFWAGHRNSRIRVIMARTWEPRIHSQGSYVETSSPFKPCHFDHFIKSTDAHVATAQAYWPSIRGSMMWRIFLLLVKKGLANTTSICLLDGRFLSMHRLPVKSSRRTTKKLIYMLLLAVK
ncbi:hypothetical protein Tco_0484766 [Tanacetum coccineum]